MSASILERIEAHQLRILKGQDEIVATLGGLVGQVNDHETRLGKLEDAAGSDASPRLAELERQQVKQGRRLRVLLWLFPVACVVSAFAGAWVALRL